MHEHELDRILSEEGKKSEKPLRKPIETAVNGAMLAGTAAAGVVGKVLKNNLTMKDSVRNVVV